MALSTQANPGKWEAWIENKNNHLHLYVRGEISDAHKHAQFRLHKGEPINRNMKELHLELIPKIFFSFPYQVLQLSYYQEVRTTEQYKTITVTSGNEVIAHLPSIEIRGKI